MFGVVFGSAGIDGQSEDGWLWPCNVEAWHYWQSVQTQWRADVSGAVGLDYAGVLAYLREHIRKPGKRKRIFSCICAAERGHLDGSYIAEQRRKQQGK
jgi:hypothetical protein